MNSKFWSRKALSACLIVALYTTFSMVALANSDSKITGELIVNGNAKVTVNGEVAQTGRSIFSASTINTPENATATVNLGSVGKVELAPNSSLTVKFDQGSITGELTAGTVTVNASNGKSVVINTVNGSTDSATAGNVFTVSADKAVKDDDDKDKKKKGGAAWIWWGAGLAAAAAGILWVAFSDNNNANIGGGGVVVSPSR
jgi:hypothetical protein